MQRERVTEVEGFEEDGVYGFFPFVDRFDQVCAGTVSCDYLLRLREVLVPAVDAVVGAVEGQVTESPRCLQIMLYIVTALARLDVAMAYRPELERIAEFREGAVCEALELEWARVRQRDFLARVHYCPEVGELLGLAIDDMVQSQVLLVSDVASLHGVEPSPAIAALRYVRVGDVVIVGSRGLPYCELEERARAAVPVTERFYRSCITRIRRAGSLDVILKEGFQSLEDVFADVVATGRTSADVLWARIWLVVNAGFRPDGYCYQDMLPPLSRFTACRNLGESPLVRVFLWETEGLHAWSKVAATYVVTDRVHVLTPGVPGGVLHNYGHLRIGMLTPVTPQSDVFAKALVDEFISRHARNVELSVLPPSDSMSTLTLDSSASGSRTFSDIATHHYAAVGESLSPRSHRMSGRGAARVDADVDGERLSELRLRLAEGPVIHEEYFRRARRRLRRAARARPALDPSGGDTYHLFSGFKADGGVGIGDWQADLSWNVPGWTSYVAYFRAGFVGNMAFSAPFEVADARMDCTGVGVMDFGGCVVSCSGTVLWFSDSIRFKLVAHEKLALRISLPDSGTAPAIPYAYRRYMHLPGVPFVARSFSVALSRPHFDFLVQRTGVGTTSGCSILAGSAVWPAGRHKFRLSGLFSDAPVKLVVKTDPSDAVEYLSVCSLRVRPRSRDRISVLFDPCNADLVLALAVSAEVKMSALQIVDLVEFEAMVAASRVNHQQIENF